MLKGLEDDVRDLLNGFPSDLGHDGALSSQVFIAQTEEVVNHKCWGEKKINTKNQLFLCRRVLVLLLV